MFALNCPLLITPLPAAISLFILSTRQRIADRLADTVVIGQGAWMVNENRRLETASAHVGTSARIQD